METINHFQCFDYMIDSANDILDEDFIKNTHKIHLIVEFHGLTWANINQGKIWWEI